jgi:type IV secretory pathway TraG/TraD family ATPase VirD4
MAPMWSLPSNDWRLLNRSTVFPTAVILQSSGEPDRSGGFIRKPQAAFFALPAGTGSLMSAEMARLVLFGLMNAAQRAPKPRRQVYVIMDEFQRAVSGNIEVLLQMARSHDVSLILANQCLDDLRSPGADIASTVINNTRIRQIFGVSTPDDLRDLTYVSGERLIFPESKGISETPECSEWFDPSSPL